MSVCWRVKSFRRFSRWCERSCITTYISSWLHIQLLSSCAHNRTHNRWQYFEGCAHTPENGYRHPTPPPLISRLFVVSGYESSHCAVNARHRHATLPPHRLSASLIYYTADACTHTKGEPHSRLLRASSYTQTS